MASFKITKDNNKVKEIVIISGANDFIAIRKKGKSLYEVQSFASDLFNKEKKFKLFPDAKKFLKEEVTSYLEGEVPHAEKVAGKMIKNLGVDKIR